MRWRNPATPLPSRPKPAEAEPVTGDREFGGAMPAFLTLDRVFSEPIARAIGFAPAATTTRRSHLLFPGYR